MATYSNLINSRYFNPAFNSAIFDGPLRIYFAQFHESSALKIYFSLQQKYPNQLAHWKETHRQFGQNILIMLYPSSEAFSMSFETAEGFVVQSTLGEDRLFGINGPFEDHRLQEILDAVASPSEPCEISFQMPAHSTI